METSFILEKKIISLCFNPTKETIFLLYPDFNAISSGVNSNNLLLTEEDLYLGIILKRFKLLEKHECNIINTNYRQLPPGTYEGYSLYFWELSDKLFVVYPYGYILIYDYNSTQLLVHFQCHGQKTYVIRNILGSPMENSFFISAENMHNIYHIDYSGLINGEKANNVYTKLILPKDVKVYDMIAHPNEKFIFIACEDGIVRVFDYNNVKNLRELPGGIVDTGNFGGGVIKNTGGGGIPAISLDINSTGSYLLVGSENGFIYLWDAFLAIKDKRVLLNKIELPSDSIFSVKFLKSKQFENLQRFVCLTKKGKIYIYFIKSKIEDNENKNNNININLNIPGVKKELFFHLVYENSTFDPIIYSFHRYNCITSSFLDLSYCNNTLAVTWPNLKLDKLKINGKLENYLLFPYFTSKIFFLYNNIYPKINYPLSTQLKYRPYESYIPSKNQPNFENKIYFADNYFVYLYEIYLGTYRKLVNYTKETGIKNLYLLKFDVKDMVSSVIFFILFETDLNKINLVMIEFDLENNAIKKLKTFDNINDFVILGNSDLNITNDYVYMLGKDLQNAFLYQISTETIISNEIDSSVQRIYHTPFTDGYCILYRNVLNELIFSENFKPISINNNNFNNNNIINDKSINNNLSSFEQFSIRDNPYEDNINNNTLTNSNNLNISSNNNNNPDNNNINNIFNDEKFKLKCGNKNQIKLEFNEREIDIIFNQTSSKYFCAMSMIDKINLFDSEMHLISSIKLNLQRNPYLISSLFFLDSTLLYSKGNIISYYYPPEGTPQKIFNNNRTPTMISGLLSDRFILVSQGTNNNIKTSELTTPMINPLEPILMGYLDDPGVNYNLVKECVVNMFTNQISEKLIKKLIKNDLKEVAWLFISDSKSSFQNLDIKINLLNEMLEFDKILENVICNKDLTNDLNIDEMIWRFNYDQSVEYIKNILIKETKVLIKYGQFDMAIKILELLGDYPKVLNLLILSSSFEEYDKLRLTFQTKKCLSFTDNLLINNAFCYENKMKDPLDPFKMSHYNKVFDKYEGEHFIFGANQNKIKINSIDKIQNKIPKVNSKINNIQKKIISYGETSYSIFSDLFNPSTQKYETVEICLLVLQKIENYYGIRNTIRRLGNQNNQKRGGFQDFNVPLDQIRSSIHNVSINNLNNSNLGGGGLGMSISGVGGGMNDSINASTVGTNDQFDIDSNADIEEISENLYLSAYYHCDKGSGEVLEDITDNNNEAKILFVPPENINNNITNNNNNPYDDINLSQNLNINDIANNNNNNNKNNENNNYIPDLWSEILEEFEPLEYEDKWGRKSPGAHSIKFSKETKTKLIIPNSPSLSHFGDKFTLEFWLKLKDINVTLFTKDSFYIEIYNGKFKIISKEKEILPIETKDYSLPLGKFSHIAILYKKKTTCLTILLNCEMIHKYNFKLSGISTHTDLVFGNGNLDCELTEIKIWNQKMPVGFLKDNYKTPLPILAENKRKLKMKINKQDVNAGKKKFDFGSNPFSFGNKETTNNNNENINLNLNTNNNIAGVPGENEDNGEQQQQQINPFSSGEGIENSVNYPSFSSVMGEKDSFNFDFNDNNINANENKNNDFNFQDDGFNFD